MSPTPDEYLTPGEAARTLGISPSTVLRWIREGRLRSDVGETGELRLRAEDVLPLGTRPPQEPCDENGD